MLTWEYKEKHVHRGSCLPSWLILVAHLEDCCRTADGYLTVSG